MPIPLNARIFNAGDKRLWEMILNAAEKDEFNRVWKCFLHLFKTVPLVIKMLAFLIACVFLLVGGTCYRWNVNDGLINAALQGDVEEAKRLIAWGADVNATGSDDDTPSALAYAIHNGNRKMVDLLLQAGADVNLRSEYRASYTPLMVAVSNHQLEIARLLIACGADVYATDNKGENLFEMVKSYKTADKQEIITLLKQANTKE